MNFLPRAETALMAVTALMEGTDYGRHPGPGPVMPVMGARYSTSIQV